MHEMSIAESIIELADEIAIKKNADSIKSIDIEIGALSGVVPEALEFAMEMIVKNSKLENARINYIKIKSEIVCLNCEKHFETNDWFVLCPECNQTNVKILNGKQLRIKSLII